MSLRSVTKDWSPDRGPEGTVLIGNKRGTWPIQFFTNEDQAAHWAGQDPNHRVWVVDVKVLYEMEYVPPGEARLRPKERS